MTEEEIETLVLADLRIPDLLDILKQNYPTPVPTLLAEAYSTEPSRPLTPEDVTLVSLATSAEDSLLADAMRVAFLYADTHQQGCDDLGVTAEQILKGIAPVVPYESGNVSRHLYYMAEYVKTAFIAPDPHVHTMGMVNIANHSAYVTSYACNKGTDSDNYLIPPSVDWRYRIVREWAAIRSEPAVSNHTKKNDK